jgi:hypothetical protein
MNSQNTIHQVDRFARKVGANEEMFVEHFKAVEEPYSKRYVVAQSFRIYQSLLIIGVDYCRDGVYFWHAKLQLGDSVEKFAAETFEELIEKLKSAINDEKTLIGLLEVANNFE